MKRTLPIWLALAACVALACGALAWLSLTTVRLERAEAKARADALVEERVRLALWRMDGRLARLIAQESTRVRPVSVSSWTNSDPVGRAARQPFRPSTLTSASPWR